jgi:hypothetical protein
MLARADGRVPVPMARLAVAGGTRMLARPVGRVPALAG